MREMGPNPTNKHTLPSAAASARGRRLERGGRNRRARGGSKTTSRGSRTAIDHAPPHAATDRVPMIVFSMRPPAARRTSLAVRSLPAHARFAVRNVPSRCEPRVLISGAAVILIALVRLTRSRHASGVAGLRSRASMRADRFAAERGQVGAWTGNRSPGTAFIRWPPGRHPRTVSPQGRTEREARRAQHDGAIGTRMEARSMTAALPSIASPRLIEVAGVAGAGKSTLTRSICERPGFRVGGFIHARRPSDLLQVLIGSPRSLPILVSGGWSAPRMSWAEFKLMTYVTRWRSVFRRDRDRRDGITVLDQGPIYALVRLKAEGKPFTTTRAFARWWDDMLPAVGSRARRDRLAGRTGRGPAGSDQRTSPTPPAERPAGR